MTHGTYVPSGDGVSHMASFEKTNFRGSELLGHLREKKKAKTTAIAGHGTVVRYSWFRAPFNYPHIKFDRTISWFIDAPGGFGHLEPSSRKLW